MGLIEVKVPDMGDSGEVLVIELLVKPGDTVREDQSLITVESDKASMEVPSSAAGVVKELKVKLGDKVTEGSLVVLLEATGAAAAAPAAAPPASSAAPAGPAPADSAPTGAGASSRPVAPMAPVELRVPDIGDFKDVSVIEVLVKTGDSIRVEQSLITVESDKASMEIPASTAGIVKEVKVKLGDTVNVGDVIAVLEGGSTHSTPVGTADQAPAAPFSPAPVPASADAGDSVSSGHIDAASRAPERASPTLALPAHEPNVPAGPLPHASPSVRRFARELGVPLAQLKGTGPKGRISQQDVQTFTQAVMKGDLSTHDAQTRAAAGGGEALDLLPWPKIDFGKFGPIERKELGRIKKIGAANLHRNWVMIPHVTNHDDADITELEAFRVATNKEHEKSGIKVTMLAFLIKASVAALKKFPDFNASLDGEQLVLKNYFHIGFAADTPGGLVVPVIKNADSKGVLQISREMAELAARARDGKLAPADMSGSCFTISSLGGIGGRYFTPIINAPEVAILGVCKSQTEPVWDGEQFLPRLMLPLSLSWDHRVLDGASAARFNAYLGAILTDFRRVLL